MLSSLHLFPQTKTAAVWLRLFYDPMLFLNQARPPFSAKRTRPYQIITGKAKVAVFGCAVDSRHRAHPFLSFFRISVNLSLLYIKCKRFCEKKYDLHGNFTNRPPAFGPKRRSYSAGTTAPGTLRERRKFPARRADSHGPPYKPGSLACSRESRICRRFVSGP